MPDGHGVSQERREQIRAEAAERLKDADRAALRYCRLDELYRLAELGASYLHSVALAAERDDMQTVTVHCKQIALVIRETFALAKQLNGEAGSNGADK